MPQYTYDRSTYYMCVSMSVTFNYNIIAFSFNIQSDTPQNVQLFTGKV